MCDTGGGHGVFSLWIFLGIFYFLFMINHWSLMTLIIIFNLIGTRRISISLIPGIINSKETGCLNKQELLTKGLQMLHASFHRCRPVACLWEGSESPGLHYSKIVGESHRLASPSVSLKRKIL